MLKTLEWAVGLFEGEGTILIRPSRQKAKVGNVEVSLTSTDQDVVEAFYAVVGVGTIYGPYQYRLDRKPFWKWMAGGEAAANVLAAFHPLLCLRRRYRAEEALMAHNKRLQQPHYRVSRRGMGGRPTHKTKMEGTDAKPAA